jgi:hypothetical protein
MQRAISMPIPTAATTAPIPDTIREIDIAAYGARREPMMRAYP